MTREVVLIILCGLFGCNACGITEDNKPKPCANKIPGKSYISPPTVVIQTFSIINGRCGCLEYSGDEIVFNPQKTCESILLCRMLHNMAIMRNLHLNLAGNLLPCPQAQAKVLVKQPAVSFRKDQDGKNPGIYSPNSKNSTSCLSKLLQKQVPSLLLKLQHVLCLFQQGKDEHNEALYREFLKQLNIVLKEAGCSVDEILGTTNVLEQITDNAGKIADRVVFEILTITDDLKIKGQLLNFVCKLLGKTLTNLTDVLSKINLNLDLGLKSIGKLLG